MAAFRRVALLGLAVCAGAVEGRAALSPVTRVVELLKSLSKKIEEESKQEEALYETFVCWGKSMLSQKTASNAAAESRIEMLNTYLADLAAGRIELTTERQDLEKEIETLTGDIEVATEVRNKEKAEFEDAEAEMQKAIDALTSAIDVLDAATKDHKEGALITMHSSLSVDETYASREQQAQRLNTAVELGEKMLTKGDARFLRRLLTGEVPKADWKKLNRKATFKMDYKARSFKIQNVLSKLLQTFQANLDEATKKEGDAQALYDKLMGAKNDQKNSALEALARMERENGAKGMSKQDAQDEVDALTTQVSDDTKYIEQVQKSMDEKKEQWKTRTEIRSGELGAISEAIGILHSDDARDTLKRSMVSQGASFLQEGLTSKAVARRGGAAKVLLEVAQQTRDARLSALAATVQGAGGHFDEVIAAIDSMLALLQREENEDLAKKEQCEKNRAADTREAILLSRGMDEHSDEITKLKAKIEDLTVEIEGKHTLVGELTAELEEATENRAKEHDEYLVATKDDEDAAKLVSDAQSVLQTFYEENGLVFAQKKQQPFTSQAGQAPPPPPPTWDGAYTGKQDEKKGIVAILGMIHNDILKDIAKADEEEQTALELFQKTESELKGSIQNLNSEITELEGAKGQAETDVENNVQDRHGKRGELGVVMQLIRDASPGCDYFNVNYPLRVTNRQTEVDGLQKAKIILNGGEFAAPEDTGREIKPGDALLSIRRIRPVHF